MSKTEGKRPHRRPRPRWDDNIGFDLQEVGLVHGLDWSGSCKGQVADICKGGDEPSGSIKCRQFLD